MALLNIHNDAGGEDILLAKYVARETDEGESQAMEKWIAASEKNKALAGQTYIAWDKTKGLAFSGSAKVDAAWEIFRERITKTPIIPVRERRLRIWSYAAAGAAIVALVIAFFNWNGHRNKPAISALKQMVSRESSRTDSLADGSVVTLYPHSMLSYDSSYDRGNRQVSLRGDAFFAVYPGRAHPFRVAVRDLTITVMGTRFSVASRDTSTEISVYKGMVEVAGKDHQQVILNAHEKLTVHLRDGEWTRSVQMQKNTH
jgi:transmembrane sensor